MKYEVTITRTKIANCETKSQKLYYNSEKKNRSQLSFIFFTLRRKRASIRWWLHMHLIKIHKGLYMGSFSSLSHTWAYLLFHSEITGHKPFTSLLCDLQFRLICSEASATEQWYTVSACLPATVRSTWAEKIWKLNVPLNSTERW